MLLGRLNSWSIAGPAAAASSLADMTPGSGVRGGRGECGADSGARPDSRPAISYRWPTANRARPDGSFVSEQSAAGAGGRACLRPRRSLGTVAEFWLIVRYAALLGVALAFAALAFLGLVKGGTKLWFTLPTDPGWFDGSLWWVAVTTGAGVLVGVLRRVLQGPGQAAGDRSRSWRLSVSSLPRCRGRSPSRWCRWWAGRASGRRQGWG